MGNRGCVQERIGDGQGGKTELSSMRLSRQWWSVCMSLAEFILLVQVGRCCRDHWRDIGRSFTTCLGRIGAVQVKVDALAADNSSVQVEFIHVLPLALSASPPTIAAQSVKGRSSSRSWPALGLPCRPSSPLVSGPGGRFGSWIIPLETRLMKAKLKEVRGR